VSLLYFFSCFFRIRTALIRRVKESVEIKSYEQKSPHTLETNSIFECAEEERKNEESSKRKRSCLLSSERVGTEAPVRVSSTLFPESTSTTSSIAPCGSDQPEQIDSCEPVCKKFVVNGRNLSADFEVSKKKRVGAITTLPSMGTKSFTLPAEISFTQISPSSSVSDTENSFNSFEPGKENTVKRNVMTESVQGQFIGKFSTAFEIWLKKTNKKKLF
jgi:hypothetical protein